MRQGRFALLALVPWLLAWTVTFFLFSLGGWRHAVSTLFTYFVWTPNLLLPIFTFAACNAVWFRYKRHVAVHLTNSWVVGALYALTSSVIAACLGLAAAPSAAFPVLTWVVISGYWGFAWIAMARLFSGITHASPTSRTGSL